MWWTSTLRTSAEDLGTLAENVPPTSTVPSTDAYFGHNMWNPLLELLFHEQANGIFATYLVDTAAHGVLYVSKERIAILAWSCSARRYNSLFHVSVLSLAGAFFFRVFPCPYHLSKGRRSMFLRPGHDLRSSLYPSMTFHTANAFDIICRLDRDDTLDDVPQNKKQKVTTSYFWTSCVNKTLLGLSLVVPHESWYRSVVIVLLTSCPT